MLEPVFDRPRTHLDESLRLAEHSFPVLRMDAVHPEGRIGQKIRRAVSQLLLDVWAHECHAEAWDSRAVNHGWGRRNQVFEPLLRQPEIFAHLGLIEDLLQDGGNLAVVSFQDIRIKAFANACDASSSLPVPVLMTTGQIGLRDLT